MKRIVNVLALVAALVSGPALAHVKGGNAMGVVESVTAERLVIKATDGHAVPFAVGPETRFFVGGKLAGVQDVRVGQRAVVHGQRSGEALKAMRVKLGPVPKS